MSWITFSWLVVATSILPWTKTKNTCKKMYRQKAPVKVTMYRRKPHHCLSKQQLSISLHQIRTPSNLKLQLSSVGSVSSTLMSWILNCFKLSSAFMLSYIWQIHRDCFLIIPVLQFDCIESILQLKPFSRIKYIVQGNPKKEKREQRCNF